MGLWITQTSRTVAPPGVRSRPDLFVGAMSDATRKEVPPDALGLVEWIWHSYVSKGQWPTWRDVDRAADRELHRDLTELARELPRWWLWPDLSRQPDIYPQDSEIRLTMASIDHVEGGHAVVELAVRVVREIVRLTGEFEPETPGQDLVISSNHLAESMGLMPGQRTQLRVVGTFFTNNDLPGIWRGLGGHDDGSWTVTVDERGARRYRGVDSAEGLLRLVTQLRESDERALRRHLVTLETSEPEVAEFLAGDAEDESFVPEPAEPLPSISDQRAGMPYVSPSVSRDEAGATEARTPRASSSSTAATCAQGAQWPISSPPSV
jgi:hypothetical protein